MLGPAEICDSKTTSLMDHEARGLCAMTVAFPELGRREKGLFFTTSAEIR